MSYVKARATHEAQRTSDNTGPDHTLMCRVTGCGRRWCVDINHGRVCSFHDDQFTHADRRRSPIPQPLRVVGSPQPVPFHQAVPHWQDDDKEGDAA